MFHIAVRRWHAAVSLIVLLCIAAGAQAGTWLMTGGNARHSFSTAEIGPMSPTVRWSVSPFEGCDWFGTAPIVNSTGVVYFAADPGTETAIYAFNPAQTLKWKYLLPLGASFSELALDSEGTIYFSSNGKLHALYANGKLKWACPVGGTPVVGDNGIIYLSSGNTLFAINPNGTRRWAYNAGGAATLPAVASDGTIYLGTTTRLLALNANGTVKWSYSISGGAGAPAIGPDGTIYFVSGSYLYALTPARALKWRYAAGGGIGPPAIDGNGIYFVAGVNVTALSQAGALKWRYPVPGEYTLSNLAIDGNGTVYFTARSGYSRVYALTPQGKEAWFYTEGFDDGRDFTGAVVGPQGTLYVATNAPFSSQQLWGFRTDGDLPIVQPDLWIRAANEPAYQGDNIYNTTADGQTSALTVGPGVAAEYAVKLQNERAETDCVKVTGSRAPAGWTVQYFVLNSNENEIDITAEVTGTGWPATFNNYGRKLLIRATPGAGIPAGASFAARLTAESMGSNIRIDTVAAVTSVPGAGIQPDIQVRNGFESVFIGDNIYNSDGAGQTKTQSAGGGVTAVYVVRIQNDSPVNAAFTVTATAGDPGWTVKYYSTANGANVTAAVAGAGWNTIVLIPGGTTHLRVEVTPAATLNAGYVKRLQVNAATQTQPSQLDIAVLETTKTGAAAAVQPDLLVRAAIDQPFWYGDNVIDPTGVLQVCTRPTWELYVPETIFVRFQNDGTTNAAFRITGTAMSSGWSVRYFRTDTGGDITAAVSGAGMLTPSLPPGGFVDMRVEVAPQDGAYPNGECLVYVTGRATTAPYLADTVILHTVFDGNANAQAHE